MVQRARKRDTPHEVVSEREQARFKAHLVFISAIAHFNASTCAAENVIVDGCRVNAARSRESRWATCLLAERTGWYGDGDANEAVGDGDSGNTASARAQSFELEGEIKYVREMRNS